MTKSPLQHQTRIFSIANQKGGVGKTTTAVNLATAVSSLKKKVLLIDLDAQGNATISLGISRQGKNHNSYTVLTGQDSIQNAIVQTSIPYLSVLPSAKELLGLDIELAHIPKPQFFLKNALCAPELNIDYVFIDCPPAVGLTTVNALTASHAIIVPIQCEYLALEGVADLIKTIERVRKNFNSSLDLHGVLLTMFDNRSRLSSSVADDVRRFFGDKVYQSVIPRNVRIPEAPSHGKPVLLYDWKCAGSQAYIRLAAEFLKKEKESLKNEH